ncbi:MAG: four helix bundle protein [Paludibacteraceae bacterium]|nr:four helix bundle protein [Paludibacteraceae bacterium]
MEFFGYRNLVAYQKAKEVRKQVYRLLKQFPKSEQFALCDQLRRAAVSITSNIAEGITRYSAKDKVHFLEISYGSLMEVMSQIEVAEEEQYITTEQFYNIEILIADTARLLSGLQKSYITPSENSQQ